MRTVSARRAAIASVLVGVVFGCSTPTSTAPAGALPASSSRDMLARTGVPPQFVADLRLRRTLPPTSPAAGGLPNVLAVSDFGTGAVEILNKNYKLTRRLTKGLLGPDGVWYDSARNLYVANYAGVNVQEYGKHPVSPTFTYSTGLKDPIAVTTDEAGNVYVADYSMGANGFVSEFPQGSNVPKATCSPGGGVEGVAVDESGDVFVSYNASGTGHVGEYVGGLSGCTETALGVPLGFAGELQVDNKHNLVVCDQGKGTVDIVAPPYGAVTSAISGFADPLSVALNSTDTMVYVADPSAGDVVVDAYPAGTLIATLGPGNGLSDPAGIAVAPPPK